MRLPRGIKLAASANLSASDKFWCAAAAKNDEKLPATLFVKLYSLFLSPAGNLLQRGCRYEGEYSHAFSSSPFLLLLLLLLRFNSFVTHAYTEAEKRSSLLFYFLSFIRARTDEREGEEAAQFSSVYKRR